METFSALLALCAGNSAITGEFPTQRPVTRNFDVFIWSAPEKTIARLVIWDAIAFIMTSLSCGDFLLPTSHMGKYILIRYNIVHNTSNTGCKSSLERLQESLLTTNRKQTILIDTDILSTMSYPIANPAGTRRNDNVIIPLKQRRNDDVIIASFVRWELFFCVVSVFFFPNCYITVRLFWSWKNASSQIFILIF